MNDPSGRYRHMRHMQHLKTRKQAYTDAVAAGVRFAPVPGFPGYQVSEDGRVWSFLRGDVWMLMSPGLGKTGRLQVTLGRKKFKVHQVVMLAFVGPCPEGMEVLHYPDNDPANCRLENLRYGTHAENMADKSREPLESTRDTLTMEGVNLYT